MRFAVIAISLLLVCAGCRDSHPPPPEASAPENGHRHEHVPPHGGTAVELGEEAAHLEFVLDATSGKMQAYVMDGELENFIRVTAQSFAVLVKWDGREETLTFKAMANNATGEKVGDTAQFEAQADWLKTQKAFSGVLQHIEIHGKSYDAVSFKFPEGNDATPAPAH